MVKAARAQGTILISVFRFPATPFLPPLPLARHLVRRLVGHLVRRSLGGGGSSPACGGPWRRRVPRSAFDRPSAPQSLSPPLRPQR